MPDADGFASRGYGPRGSRHVEVAGSAHGLPRSLGYCSGRGCCYAGDGSDQVEFGPTRKCRDAGPGGPGNRQGWRLSELHTGTVDRNGGGYRGASYQAKRIHYTCGGGRIRGQGRGDVQPRYAVRRKPDAESRGDAGGRGRPSDACRRDGNGVAASQCERTAAIVLARQRAPASDENRGGAKLSDIRLFLAFRPGLFWEVGSLQDSSAPGIGDREGYAISDWIQYWSRDTQ